MWEGCLERVDRSLIVYVTLEWDAEREISTHPVELGNQQKMEKGYRVMNTVDRYFDLSGNSGSRYVEKRSDHTILSPAKGARRD